MKQLTVKDLLILCLEQMEKGNENKNIVISDDTEGNGYHGLFYGFTDIEDEYDSLIYESITCSEIDTIILG